MGEKTDITVAEDGDYLVVRVRKADAIPPDGADLETFWGPHKEYCARCGDGRLEPITAKNSLEAAIVGIAKCGGPCQVSRGGCG